MENNILELHNVNIYYGSVHVVHNLNLYVEKNELVYLTGRNGAGKTTTLKSIVGFIPPREGSIKLEGVNISGTKPFFNARQGIGYVPDDRRIFPFLTVKENLTLFSAKTKPERGWTLEKAYDFFPSLKKLHNNKAGNLSGGEQEMLAIARALMRDPKLLLLDEPFEGLAPLIVKMLEDVFRKIKSQVSILLVDLNMNAASRLSNRCYMMDRGVIIKEYSHKEMDQITERKM